MVPNNFLKISRNRKNFAQMRNVEIRLNDFFLAAKKNSAKNFEKFTNFGKTGVWSELRVDSIIKPMVLM